MSIALHSPSVSIIVPIYNTAQYLAECLDSIINQTLVNIEIICVNDGSTDGSGLLLEEYQKKDKRIVIHTQKNAGLSAARNAGIKIATGAYIGFIDSDDWIDTDFFEKLYRIVKDNNADVAMANFKWFYPEKNVEELSWISDIIKSISPKLVTEVEDRKKVIGTSTVCNKLFLKDFLISNNFWFFEGLYWEDNPYTIMTAIKANKIGIVSDTFYYCRKTETSIIGTAASDRKPFDIFEIMARLKPFFDVEKKHLHYDYQYYYEELLFINYYYSLVDRIHKKYKKEFYNRVKSEFKKLDKSSTVFLTTKYLDFKNISKSSYGFFVITSGFKNMLYKKFMLVKRIVFKS